LEIGLLRPHFQLVTSPAFIILLDKRRHFRRLPSDNGVSRRNFVHVTPLCDEI